MMTIVGDRRHCQVFFNFILFIYVCVSNKYHNFKKTLIVIQINLVHAICWFITTLLRNMYVYLKKYTYSSTITKEEKD